MRRYPPAKTAPKTAKKAKKALPKRGKSRISPDRLQEMIAEVTADAYDEDEATMGFFSLLEEEIAFPFETVVLGVPVTIERLTETSRGIAVIAARGATRQAIAIEALPLPSPPPPGAEWIEAYKAWARMV